jgi:hypothetical protein
VIARTRGGVYVEADLPSWINLEYLLRDLLTEASELLNVSSKQEG